VDSGAIQPLPGPAKEHNRLTFSPVFSDPQSNSAINLSLNWLGLALSPEDRCSNDFAKRQLEMHDAVRPKCSFEEKRYIDHREGATPAVLLHRRL
jgi:hypothetical protein